MAGLLDIGTISGTIQITDKVSEVVDGVNKKLDVFGQKFSGTVGAVTLGATSIVAAIGAITTGIITLGEKGSVVIGVEDAFNKLSASIGQTGEALLGGLQAGVRNTVDSFELMQSANRALSAGVKLTADDMRVLGATAREMAKAAGTDAAGELDKLFRALTTGQPRLVRMAGITVDLEKHQKQLAASLGTTSDKLSRQGQILAAQNAILEGVRNKLNQFGESQLSFKERVQQAQIAIGDWFTELQKAVARSPAVNKAFQDITKAFTEAFGEKGQTLIQVVMKGIDSFAQAVSNAAPLIGKLKDEVVRIIDEARQFWDWLVNLNEEFQITQTVARGAHAAFTFLKSAFDFVRGAAESVVEVWKQMPEWLREIARIAVIAGAGITAIGFAAQAVSAPVAAFVNQLDLAINVFGNLSSGVVATNILFGQQWTAISKTTTVIGAYVLAVDSMAVATQFWTAAGTKALGMLGSLTVSTGLLTAAQRVATGVTATLTHTKTALAGATVFVARETMSFAAMLGLETAATRAAGAAGQFLIGVKTLLTTAYTAVTGAVTRFTASMGASTFALRAGQIAAQATTIAMGVLGTALIAITSIPFVATVGAFVLSLEELGKAFTDTWNRWKRGEEQSFVEFISQKDEDNWVRRFLGIGAAARQMREEVARETKAAADAFNKSMEDLRGITARKEMELIELKITALTSAERAGEAAIRRLGSEIQQLGIPLEKLPLRLREMAEAFQLLQSPMSRTIDDGDKLTKTFTTAADVVVKMRDAMRELKTQAAGFQLFAGGDPTGLPLKMQQEWLGALQAIIDKGGDLTASQQKVFDILDKTIGKVAQLKGLDLGLDDLADTIMRMGSDLGQMSLPLFKQLGDRLQTAKDRGQELAPVLQMILDAKPSATAMISREQVLAFLDKLLDKVSATSGALANLRAKETEEAAKAAKEFGEKNLQMTMTGTQLKLRQIEIERQAEITKLRGDSEMRSIALKEINAFYDHQVRLATESADTISERLRLAGVKTQQELQRHAEKLRQEYLILSTAIDPVTGKLVESAQTIRKAWEDWQDAMDAAAGKSVSLWRTMVAPAIIDVIKHLTDAINGSFAQMLLGAKTFKEGFIDIWESIKAALLNIFNAILNVFVNQFLKGMIGALSGVKGSFSSAFSGLIGSGVKGFGSSILGALGVGVGGAGIGTVAGAGSAYAASAVSSTANAALGIGLSAATVAAIATGVGAAVVAGIMIARANRNVTAGAREEFAQDLGFGDDEAALGRLYRDLGKLGERGRELKNIGLNVIGKQDEAANRKWMADVTKFYKDLEEGVKRYNLAVENMIDPAMKFRSITDTGRDLAQTFTNLTSIYQPAAVLKGMAPDLNDWLSAAIKAGSGIPPEIGKIIKELVTSKQLTEDNARALLGLAEDGVPSLKEVEEAAGRYGLKLDDLGPKVQQMRITEAADQIVKDFNTLTAAGVPFDVLMKDISIDVVDAEGNVTKATIGMHKAIQDLVTKALKEGLKLPASMKPIIDKLIEAGGLTDEFGDKLVDTSRLEFEVPLVDRISDLIDAINDMIAAWKLMSPTIDTEVDKSISSWRRWFDFYKNHQPSGDAFSGPTPPTTPPAPPAPPAPGTMPTPAPAPTPQPGGGTPAPIIVQALDSQTAAQWLQQGNNALTFTQAVAPYLPQVVEFYGEA